MVSRKKKAVRNILGEVDHFTNSKTRVVRNPISGKVVGRRKVEDFEI